jgi:SAM-dependent methyltransferase
MENEETAMSDEIVQFNRERWDALAKAGLEYTQPFLGLNTATARQVVDPYQLLGEVRGKQVLCLAGGGGQQSAAFALLGADVTVLDLSSVQLERDQEALTHYGLRARLEQGDMRDLSRFESSQFDIVWHAWSINFIPDTAPVFDEVRRVLRPQGLYHLTWGNPFTKGMDETDWTGNGYLMHHLYGDCEVRYKSDVWDVHDPQGNVQQVVGPREFNHTLSTVVNGLINRDFQLLGMWEDDKGDAAAPPGSWEHFKAVAPRTLTLWARYQPR